MDEIEEALSWAEELSPVLYERGWLMDNAKHGYVLAKAYRSERSLRLEAERLRDAHKREEDHLEAELIRERKQRQKDLEKATKVFDERNQAFAELAHIREEWAIDIRRLAEAEKKIEDLKHHIGMYEATGPIQILKAELARYKTVVEAANAKASVTDINNCDEWDRKIYEAVRKYRYGSNK